MNNSALVSDRERVCDLGEQAQAIAYQERTLRQMLPEVLPIEPLHGEEALAVSGLPMSDIGHDAGVAQLGKQLGFADEPLALVRPANASTQQLESNQLAAIAIAGPIDHPHATAASGLVDLKAVRKEATWRELKILHRYSEYTTAIRI